MDYETDRGIQAVLRKEMFTTTTTTSSSSAAAAVENSSNSSPETNKKSDRTLVTIAHRLRTIADYDRVVVMGAGRIVE